ncbi:sensor histidine kinase [Streptomyces sp. NPDC090052]|uniref:sensor histidine kinase n=1 Tax=unclassified Streptomyces TaxID=2593676 RepID=UPI00224E417D|nr:sensor histidine kinase [Streptomyces sp. NBC_01306]MCX4722849.1 sensor histidine kinase [Streptomyces sp. NBC_01306]
MDPRALTPALLVLRLCLHLLMAGLLVLAAVRALTGHAANAPAVVAAAVVLGAVYAAGAVWPSVRTSRRSAAVWLGVLGLAWLALLVVSPEGLWVAFPLYFLQLHLLPVRWSVPLVVVTAGAAIAAYVGHGAALNPGAFIGPLLGAAVAVATVLGYQVLYRESESRRRLIEELISTRAELAAAERTAGTLAERERLAREIHDTLAQGLSSIQLLLRAAGRTLPADAPAAAHIEQARQAAQDNLAEARRFVRALSPPALEHGSLAAALDRLCTGGPGPRVRFSTSGTPVALPTPYEVALLRIAQSALANTVQHAGASRAEITLSFMETAVALDVVDDGSGFDPLLAGTASGDGGFGLPAMRSRVESLGGTFAVESTPGQGTAIAVTLPLPDSEEVPMSEEVSP